MNDRSLFYSFPQIYKWGLQMIPWKKHKEKYQYIVQMIDNDITVLEPACGPALLSEYLQNHSLYTGFDINEKFVNFAQKRGVNVYLGDAYNPSSYFSADVMVLCDAMHHIGLEGEEIILGHALKYAKKKLIICEPFIDKYLDALPSWIPGGQRLLKWWFNYIERDGPNRVNIHHLRTQKELKNLMLDGFGIVPANIKRDFMQLGENFIITYYL